MASRTPTLTSTCARCARALPRSLHTPRPFSTSRPSRDDSKPPQTSQTPDATAIPAKESPSPEKPEKQGAFTRRLEEATEEALLTRSGRRAVSEAGFSEDLKARLEARISAASASSPEIAPGAGSGTRHHATSTPWTGTESTHDAVLRMLDDATPRLKPELRGPGVQPPVAKRRVGGAQRAAGARERAETYRDTGLSERERGARKEEFAEKFGTGVRGVPSLTGLASMADQRIEEAIARGQFKNIPRGPGVKRDTRSDNPFVDTTEYIMNNMIKRQELVPPWIEKQQDLLRSATALRTELRASWARHVASDIASRGGSLDEQVRRAEAHARAEAALPRRRGAGEVSAPAAGTDDAIFRSSQTGMEDIQESGVVGGAGAGRPFRDPAWEARQAKYLSNSIEKLNAQTRSYNLMAPDLAKKAYFSAERELEACYREAAPLVAAELKKRAERKAAGGTSLFGGMGGGGGGGGERVVYEKAGGEYGFKEMWRDLWKR